MLMPWQDARRAVGVIAMTAAAGAAIVVAGMLIAARPANGATMRLDNDGRSYQSGPAARRTAQHHNRQRHGNRRRARPAGSSVAHVARPGVGIVASRSGVHARVSPSAQPRLQCVVDYIETHGIRITAMRGFGRGTVRASLHPVGLALDINQVGRDRTVPHIPVAVANAAGVHCDVVSGGTWGKRQGGRDSGHWNARATRYANRRRHAI